jgi:uncharacterized membrane protein
MEVSGILNAVFRWLHVIAGIIWIGHLYFFNFVNIPFAAKMKEAGAAKTVVPELMPRALFWFRWGAAWTWIYHGGIMFDYDSGASWGPASFAAVALTFLGVFIYDALYKSPLAENPKVAHTVAFLLTAAVLLLMAYPAHMTFRAYNIHIGAMFGTAMAFNVWFRIWPAQQQIIAAVKAGDAPDPALPALAGSRSKHNTYMSVPLLWTMINSHTAATQFGSWGWLGLLIMILLGWHVVFHFYRISMKVEGF